MPSTDAPPLITRHRELLATLETGAPGTAAVMDSTSGSFIVYNPRFRPIIPPVQRPALSSSENLQAVPGAYHAELEFDVDLMTDGAGGIPPWALTFFPPCNLIATGNVYKPVTYPALISTVTIGYNEGIRQRVMAGCMGDVSFPLKSGEPAKAHFRFMGLLASDTDTAFSNPTLPTVVPPRYANALAVAMAGTWGSYVPRISTAEWRLGNTVIMRPDASTAPGFRSALVVSRDPTVVIDPESVLNATFNWFSKHLNSTQGSFTSVIGATNNKITFAFPNASIRERPSGERDQIITEGGLVIQANRLVNVDSDFTITFA